MCALVPSSPSSRSQTTSLGTRGASPPPHPTRPGRRRCSAPPSLPRRRPSASSPMRTDLSGRAPEPPPPRWRPAGKRSPTWRATTQMTQVSERPPSCCCFMPSLIQNMGICLSLPHLSLSWHFILHFCLFLVPPGIPPFLVFLPLAPWF